MFQLLGFYFYSSHFPNYSFKWSDVGCSNIGKWIDIIFSAHIPINSSDNETLSFYPVLGILLGAVYIMVNQIQAQRTWLRYYLTLTGLDFFLKYKGDIKFLQ